MAPSCPYATPPPTTSDRSGIVGYSTTTINGTSTVKVESITFEAGDAPTLAYLVTCRTYHHSHADRTNGTGLLFPNGTVRSTGGMQWADGRWKFAYRGGFTPDPPGGRAT